MKTTLDLPDELMREVKIRAARENRRLKDVVAELLQRGLASGPPSGSERRRMRFPIIEGGHPAAADQEMTPDRVAAVLVAGDVESLRQ